MTQKNPLSKQSVLIVLDGWGYREDATHNAIATARTPNFDRYWSTYPHTLLEASGLAVGLPDGQMGNSEIGHTTIGAGKAIDTDLVRIKKAIDSGEFDTNPAFLKLFDHVKENGSTLHVMGLLSDGGVHSHSDHLYAFLKAAKNAGIRNAAVHIFTDGRDTPPQSALQYITELENVMEKINFGFIATLAGRFYAMDRDNNWDRLAKVEQTLFERKGNICDISPSDLVKNLYKDGKIDEHLEPIIFAIPNAEDADSADDLRIKENDGVFFFNFRADRARMLSSKMIDRSQTHNICFVTMTSYGKGFEAHVAYPQTPIETTLAKEISAAGLTQAHIAETEKFPHATYFLNGGVEKPYPGETHILLDSRKDVPTHDLAPKMRAEAIADKAIEQIQTGANFIFINFANPDMVGHTANVPAIIEAVEEVDLQLGRVVDALVEKNGIAFITADHGNAEVNIDPFTGEKHTAHTTNKVPAIVTSKEAILRGEGTLADIAPTIFRILGVEKPQSMTGDSLIG